MLALVCLWGVRFYQNNFTPFFGMLYGSLICLSIKNCLTLSIFFYLILCHQLHSSTKHSKLSFCFSGFWEIQILFPNYILRSSFWVDFPSCLITSVDLWFFFFFLKIGQVSLIWRHSEQQSELTFWEPKN